MESNHEFTPTQSRYLVITQDYLFPVGIILFSAFLWWVFVYSSIFRVQNFNCQLDYETCQNDAIISELNKYKGQNIIIFDTTQLANRLTAADFTIRKADIKKHLPNTLVVSLQSVYPYVAIKNNGETQWITFDKELRVLGVRTQDPNVPTLTVNGVEDLVVGQVPSNNELKESLALIPLIYAEIPTVKSAQVENTNILLKLDKSYTVTMTTKLPAMGQIHTLQSLLAQATILEGISEIDLRFAQPVLR